MLRTTAAVFVSGGGTNLQAIIDASERGELPHVRLGVVVSDREGAYALERAAKARIEAVTLVRKTLGKEEWERQALELLAKKGVKVLVLAGFISILSSSFISAFDGKIINVHPALLPDFGGKGYYGLKVHEAVLNSGVEVTGATVHFVNEIPDGGQIIAQKKVEILHGDTPEVLQRRVMQKAEWVLLPAALEQVCKELAEG